jgi:hypothetical protein
MNASITIRRSLQVRLIAAALLVVVTALQASALTTPNLLVDPRFENPVLTPFTQILGPPRTPGVWGGENAANVTGPVAGINPAAGVRMHRMDDDGLSATQSWQLVNLAAYAGPISAGGATIDFNALFNVPQDVQAAVGSIGVSFFTSVHAPVGPPFTAIGVNPDSNPASWQGFGLSSVAVPPTAGFVRLQVAYANATMVNSAGAARPGFVDAARLTLTYVPEPSTMGLGSIAMASLLWLRKRR